MMTSDVTLAELATVDLPDIVTYLSAAGWRETGTYSRSAVWTLTLERGEVEVLVPAARELRDYAGGVADIASTLSAVEDRPVADIVRDLRSTQVDVQYVRTMPTGPSGTIPLSEGFRAVKGTHDLLLTAATATATDERPHLLTGTRPAAAKSFVDHVRLGQTSVGSYVLRVESPLPSLGAEPLLSSRAVLLLLHQATTSARTAAEQTSGDDFTAFDSRIGDGVSANLCEALVEIGGQRQSPFELRSVWATALPVEVETPAVEFTRPMIDTLKRAGKYLRALPVTTSATVTGRVIGLDKSPTDKLGKVRLDGIINTGNEKIKQERIAMWFTRGDYELAIDAHRLRETHMLRVTGQLRHTGRQYEISRVDLVEILPATDR